MNDPSASLNNSSEQSMALCELLQSLGRSSYADSVEEAQRDSINIIVIIVINF
jgi:hypothetical protein